MLSAKFVYGGITISLVEIGISIGIALAVIGVLLIIRWILYSRLRKWAKKTETQWDDIIIHAMDPVLLAWSIWLGIFAGLQLSTLPANLEWIHQKVIPIITVFIGIYTIIVLILLFLNWFSEVVAKETKSRIDDIIVGILRIALPVVFASLGIILILYLAGLDIQAVITWLDVYGLSIGIIVAIAIAALLCTTAFIPHLIHTSITKLSVGESEEELKKRSETLVGVSTASIQVIIVIIAFLMIISKLGQDIAAILAGLGVVGIAVGFGAQSLVKDFLAGLFIIFENQYRKGDVVRIADTSGLVEEINLRRTILRDLDGIVHVVPNGEIRVASNFTKIWSRVNINISVAYKTDLDQAIKIINRVGKELAEDAKFSEAILTPPQFLRVDNLGDSGIDLKILGETKPIRQWEVMGELRLRLKREFDREGIEIPWPHMKVYFGDDPLTIKRNK